MHLQGHPNLTASFAPGRIGRAASRRARHVLGRGLLALLLAGTAAAPVLALPFQLPALVEPASPEHHVGKVIFAELVTPDLAATEHFYGGLFGWTFHDTKTGAIDYAEAILDGHPVAGLLQKPVPAGTHRQPAWLSFFAVHDVDATEKVALQHGAQVLFAPHTFPDRGREAVFADPQGAVFAILASSSGDPPDFLAAPGEWIWSSLITSNPDTDAAFYQALFNYDVFDLSTGGGAAHLLLASENYARASVNALPVSGPDARPYWLNYIRVEDAVKTTAKVVALGGRVLVAPRVDRHGGKIAVVADPLGAPFGLLEWSDTQSKEVSK